MLFLVQRLFKKFLLTKLLYSLRVALSVVEVSFFDYAQNDKTTLSSF